MYHVCSWLKYSWCTQHHSRLSTVQSCNEYSNKTSEIIINVGILLVKSPIIFRTLWICPKWPNTIIISFVFGWTLGSLEWSWRSDGWNILRWASDTMAPHRSWLRAPLPNTVTGFYNLSLWSIWNTAWIIHFLLFFSYTTATSWWLMTFFVLFSSLLTACACGCNLTKSSNLWHF